LSIRARPIIDSTRFFTSARVITSQSLPIPESKGKVKSEQDFCMKTNIADDLFRTSAIFVLINHTSLFGAYEINRNEFEYERRAKTYAIYITNRHSCQYRESCSKYTSYLPNFFCKYITSCQSSAINCAGIEAIETCLKTRFAIRRRSVANNMNLSVLSRRRITSP